MNYGTQAKQESNYVSDAAVRDTTELEGIGHGFDREIDRLFKIKSNLSNLIGKLRGEYPFKEEIGNLEPKKPNGLIGSFAAKTLVLDSLNCEIEGQLSMLNSIL